MSPSSTREAKGSPGFAFAFSLRKGRIAGFGRTSRKHASGSSTWVSDRARNAIRRLRRLLPIPDSRQSGFSRGEAPPTGDIEAKIVFVGECELYGQF